MIIHCETWNNVISKNELVSLSELWVRSANATHGKSTIFEICETTGASPGTADHTFSKVVTFFKISVGSKKSSRRIQIKSLKSGIDLLVPSGFCVFQAQRTSFIFTVDNPTYGISCLTLHTQRTEPRSDCFCDLFQLNTVPVMCKQNSYENKNTLPNSRPAPRPWF